MGDGWGGPYPPAHPQGRGIGWACNRYSTRRLGDSPGGRAPRRPMGAAI